MALCFLCLLLSIKYITQLRASYVSNYMHIHVHVLELWTHTLTHACTCTHVQNMQSTSQRALRSGDAGTLADLLPSHQSTLVLMGEQAGQLESCVREAEEAKQRLTQHIHRSVPGGVGSAESV